MSSEGQVTLLVCGNCGSQLSGISSDAIFFCSNCGSCWMAEEGLSRLKAIICGGSETESIHLPFWEVRATIRVLNRVTRVASVKSFSSGPRYFDPHFESGLMSTWRDSEGKSLIFPAFATGRILSTGVLLDRNPPSMNEIVDMDYPAVVGGTIIMSDAIELARGIAVGIEVAGEDFLAKVEIDFKPLACRLVALPCMPGKAGLTIADSGVGILYSSMPDWEEIREWHHSSP